MLATAFSTPLPRYRPLSPSRSSSASNAPVEAPEGTAARAIVPSSSPISTSTVGLPRESRISRATIASMVATGTPCSRRDDSREPIGTPELARKGVTVWKRDCAGSRYRARLDFMRAAALAVFAVAATALSGCVAVNTTQPGGGRVQLVNDLASRLDRSATLTYTAVYRLPQGATGTISQAQDPG